jgi:hypothetical protein
VPFGHGLPRIGTCLRSLLLHMQRPCVVSSGTIRCLIGREPWWRTRAPGRNVAAADVYGLTNRNSSGRVKQFMETV